MVTKKKLSIKDFIVINKLPYDIQKKIALNLKTEQVSTKDMIFLYKNLKCDCFLYCINDLIMKIFFKDNQFNSEMYVFIHSSSFDSVFVPNNRRTMIIQIYYDIIKKLIFEKDPRFLIVKDFFLQNPFIQSKNDFYLKNKILNDVKKTHWPFSMNEFESFTVLK